MAAPWAKSGQVAPWLACLADENDSDFSGWFDSAGNRVTNLFLARGAGMTLLVTAISVVLGTCLGIACGIFGQTWLGGLGGVSLASQLIGTALGVLVALVGGFLVYGLLKSVTGIRLNQEQEYYGADLSIHKIGANSQD